MCRLREPSGDLDGSFTWIHLLLSCYLLQPKRATQKSRSSKNNNSLFLMMLWVGRVISLLFAGPHSCSCCLLEDQLD